MTCPHTTLADQLAQGIAALKIALSDEQMAKLLAFVQLLRKWNRVVNLTAVRDPHEMVTRHLLDSLAVIPCIQGSRLLDVGSGAGLPGIPLAIALPERQVVLLDSVAKKTRFITQTVGELRLSNAVAETKRVEQYQPIELFDTVVSRAFSNIAKFVALSGRLIRSGGVLVAMKGRFPDEELAALPGEFRVLDVVSLSIPGLAEARHAVVLAGATADASSEVLHRK